MEDHNPEGKNYRQSSSLWMGLIFIVGGAVILLNQFDILPFELNWWALFILMPASGFLNKAYQRYQTNQNLLTTEVIFSGLMGLFLIILAISLLIGAAWNFNWNLLWPFILILIGAGMLFSRDN